MTTYERLTDRLPKRGSVGISGGDIERIPFTEDYLSDIHLAIASPELTDKQMGLFFANSLPIERLSEPQKQAFASVAIAGLEGGDIVNKDSYAQLLVKFSPRDSAYRSQMLMLLQDSSSVVRRTALNSYLSYARSMEIDPFLPFEQDDEVSEIAMGGPLRFILRDEALKTIESIIEKNFHSGISKTALPDGEVVHFRSWTLFLKWKRSQRPFWQRLWNP